MITPLPHTGQSLPIHSSVRGEGRGAAFCVSVFLRGVRFLVALGFGVEAEALEAGAEDLAVAGDGCTGT